MRHFAFVPMTRSSPFCLPAFFAHAVTVSGAACDNWPVAAHAPPPSATNTAIEDITFA